MSVLHVLLPALTRYSADPGFARWLAHGDRLPTLANARDDTLRELFHFAGDAIPAAALRHHCHADDAALGAWLAADPSYARCEATGVRLMAWPIEDLTAEEATQLAATLRPLCGDSGTPLSVDTPSTWCLQLPDGAPAARFVPPLDALGVDMLECLPSGDAGRAWRRLFNEIQVALHAHPVNATRVAADKLPVNALWFWGPGSLPTGVTTTLTRVASGDDVLRGLATLSGAVCVASSPGALDAPDRAGDALLDLDASEHADNTGQWLACFQRWLGKHHFDTIVLTFAGGERFHVRHVHRLRFWRHG